jgi:hypothetical protein
MNEMVICSKNTALLGSALALMAVEEPWPVSVPVGSLASSNRRDGLCVSWRRNIELSSGKEMLGAAVRCPACGRSNCFPMVQACFREDVR